MFNDGKLINLDKKGNKKMNIFVYENFDSEFRLKNLTGMEISAQHFIEALSKEVKVTTLPLSETKKNQKIEYISNLKEKSKKSQFFWKQKEFIRTWFEKHQFDAIILNRPNFNVFSSFQEVTQSPVIIWCHSILKNSGEFDQILACASIARNCDAICFPTNYIKEYVGKHLQSNTMLRVLPNGVDTILFKQSNKIIEKKKVYSEVGWKNIDSKTVGFVSRLEPEKGIIPMLETARLLPDINFILVGEICGRYENLIGPNVAFTGPKKYNELPKYYNSFDIFCFPSIGGPETFGLVCLEAMSCGVVPIVLKGTAPAEVVANCGVEVENQTLNDVFCGFSNCVSPKYIADKIIWLIQNEEIRNRLSRKSINRAKTFQWKIVSQKAISLIDELKKAKVFNKTMRKRQIRARFVPKINTFNNSIQTACMVYDPLHRKNRELNQFITCEEGIALNMILEGHSIEEIIRVLTIFCEDEEKAKNIAYNALFFIRTYNAANGNTILKL